MKINIEEYWIDPPPSPSPSLAEWMERIRNGWRRNRRIGQMGYYQSARFFNVYIWEYINVLSPEINRQGLLDKKTIAH